MPSASSSTRRLLHRAKQPRGYHQARQENRLKRLLARFSKVDMAHFGLEALKLAGGTLGGYVLSRICWARKVDQTLARHDTYLKLILDHFGIKIDV